MSGLKAEGAVFSVQGRGTFISCNYDVILDSLNTNNSVTEMIELAGYKPGVAFFEKRIVKADEGIANGLKLEVGADVLMCARIRLADGAPVAYTSDYLAPHLATRFLELTSETASLYKFLEEQCDVAVGPSVTQIIPVVADSSMAELLRVTENSPLMKFIAKVSDVFGNPLIYAVEYFRPDKFNFIVTRGR
jgi:GntR family transcriptional regulator